MKTAEELDNAISSILADGVNFNMYFGFGSEESRTYERANLLDGAATSILHNYSAGLRRFFDNEELVTGRLSRIDRRESCLWHYDLKETPAEFDQLELVQMARIPKVFSFEEHAITDIKTIAVRIASANSSVVLVKKVYPVSFIKRDQIFLIKSADRLDVFNDDIVRVGFGFEVLLLDNEFYINDFAKFERAFAFDAIADRASKKLGKTVLELDIADDIKDYLKAGRISRRDVFRTSDSIVLTLKPAAILEFALLKQEKTGLKVVGGKLQLNSLESVKKLFNLLNDDYLTSELTSLDYETLAKNKISLPMDE